jgi:predicted transposase YdaD
MADEVEDVIAAILLSRFNGRSITEICAIGGITLDDFTSSVAYKEIFALGLEEGRQEGWPEGRKEGRVEGRQTEATALTLRQLQRRFGALSSDQCARIQFLTLSQREALAEALLDFQTPDNLTACLEREES